MYFNSDDVFSDIYIYIYSIVTSFTIMQVNTAFFRGTATGGGVTEDTNQRLKVCCCCSRPSPHSHHNGYSSSLCFPRP